MGEYSIAVISVQPSVRFNLRSLRLLEFPEESAMLLWDMSLTEDI